VLVREDQDRTFAQKAERKRVKMEAMQHLNDTIKDLAVYSTSLRKSMEEAEQNYKSQTK
jgi:hypothetical protein